MNYICGFEEGNRPPIPSSGGSRQCPDHPWMSEASTDTEDRDVTAGTLIALGPRVAHTAKAHTDCAILLTFAMSHK